MKYAFFENVSLRGYTTSYRGRATFANGKFQGRVQSIMYGEGGALVRDFSFLFGDMPQKAQPGINHWVNVENVQRVGVAALNQAYFYLDISNRSATYNQISDVQSGRAGEDHANAVGSGYFGAVWSLTRPEKIRFIGSYIASQNPGTAPVTFDGTTVNLGGYRRPKTPVSGGGLGGVDLGGGDRRGCA
jgi:hypothetical protein